MNWQIFVVAVLLAIIVIMLTYKCQTKTPPPHPDFKKPVMPVLPVPVITNTNICDNVSEIDIVWTMDFSDYDDSDYTINNVAFMLTAETEPGSCGNPGGIDWQQKHIKPSNTPGSVFTRTNQGKIYTYTYILNASTLGTVSTFVSGAYTLTVEAMLPGVTSTSSSANYNIYDSFNISGLPQNVQTNKSSYTSGDLITCSWSAPDQGCPIYNYDYNVCISQTNGVCVGGTQCDASTSTAWHYQIDDTAPIGPCSGQGGQTSNPRMVKLSSGTYIFGVRSNYTCGATRGKFSYSDPFTVV